MLTTRKKYNRLLDDQRLNLFSETQRVEDKYRYRVVLVHPSAGVNWSGGSEVFAIELTRRLSFYFEVELLAGASCSPYYHSAGGIPRSIARQFIHNPLFGSILRKASNHPDIVVEHLTSFLPCATRLLRHPADLIFPCNDYGGLAMAAFVRSLKGTPILYTEHNGLLADGACLTRNLQFHPDQLVVFSEAVAKFARTIQPTQAVNVIPNGVDIDRFTPEGDRLDFGVKPPVVLCVASLNRNGHKRVELAIKAVARLPEVSLVVCGDGGDRAYFQALGNELLGRDRFAIHTASFDQMPTVYRSANAFTLPSLDEPFGLAYLEAMACGLPVVTTDDEMRRSIVANGGILCDVTNSENYAAALVSVLRGDCKLTARQNALRFSWDTITLNYRDLILRTIKQSRKLPY